MHALAIHPMCRCIVFFVLLRHACAPHRYRRRVEQLQADNSELEARLAAAIRRRDEEAAARARTNDELCAVKQQLARGTQASRLRHIRSLVGDIRGPVSPTPRAASRGGGPTSI